MLFPSLESSKRAHKILTEIQEGWVLSVKRKVVSGEVQRRVKVQNLQNLLARMQSLAFMQKIIVSY